MDPDQAADPQTKVLEEEVRYAAARAAARAAAAAAPTPVSGDRPEAASTAAGKIKTYHGPNHVAEL